MPVSIESLGLDRMSVEERVSLMQAIWASIAESGEDVPLGEILSRGQVRRDATVAINFEDVVPWEYVKVQV
jgi:hypothetical protein